MPLQPTLSMFPNFPATPNSPSGRYGVYGQEHKHRGYGVYGQGECIVSLPSPANAWTQMSDKL